MGLIAGSPLAALKAGVWSDAARTAYPALQDMQQKEADALKPLLHSMSVAQVCPCCVCVDEGWSVAFG